MRTKKDPIAAYLILSFLLVTVTTAMHLSEPLSGVPPAHFAQEPQPTPMMGRFAVPEMPEDPTQIDIGNNLYFYHCMPCHGDAGQGLTDEFRAAWVEDHQNCWARGCHTGRPEDEGFPIPRSVPPVVASQLIIHFPTAQKLYDYLRSSHPPQKPGILEDDEYWALTAFLWFRNGQLPPGIELAPETDEPSGPEINSQSESKIEPEDLAQTEPMTEHAPRLKLSPLAIILIASIPLILLILLFRKKMNTRHPTFEHKNTDE